MELRHLRSFCVVAEEGHVTRAAKRLSIAQPALTQQIKLLEAELGVTLQHRAGRGIRITPAGRYFQVEAQNILRNIREASDRVREIHGDGTRSIRIGFSDVETVVKPVTNLLKRYRKAQPLVVVHESLMEPRQIASALLDGRVDAAFSCAAVPDRHDISRILIGSSHSLFGVPIGHRLAASSGIRLAELATIPFILVSHGETPGSFEANFRKVCAEKNVTPQVFEVTSSLLIALNMVASNAGIALLPGATEGILADSIAYIPLLDCPELIIQFALYVNRGVLDQDIVTLKKLAVAMNAVTIND